MGELLASQAYRQELLPGALVEVSDPRVSFKTHEGRIQEAIPSSEAPSRALLDSCPYRTFRWYAGQQHFSGTYWSSTMTDHVIYESRLELCCLLLADMDPGITSIAAQPFKLTAEVNGKTRNHIPDFILSTSDGPAVVDVKPRRRLTNDTVAFTLEWTRRTIEAQGWTYVMMPEPDRVVLENVRFLAGFRRDSLADQGLIAEVLTAVPTGESSEIHAVLAQLKSLPHQQTRWTLFHLIWRGELKLDTMTARLSPTSRVRRTP